MFRNNFKIKINYMKKNRTAVLINASSSNPPEKDLFLPIMNQRLITIDYCLS